MTATQQIDKLGKLISNQDGRCGGPRYGQVYTAPEGDHGFIEGYRRKDNEGLGLIGRKWFATRKAALDYAAKVTD